MKFKGKVCFFLGGVTCPIMEFLEGERQINGFGGYAVGSFQVVEPLFDFMGKPVEGVDALIE